MTEEELANVLSMLHGMQVQLGRIEVQMEALAKTEARVESLSERIARDYVSKTEFEPFKKLIAGMVGLSLASVVGAILALIIKGH